jgi:heme exporter protein B
MNSSWTTEISAVFLKEAKIEMRGKTGITTGSVFALCTVVTIALALYSKDPNKLQLQDVCASLIWVVILFASLLTLPRTFLGEEEQKTADLLRLTARPHAIFWGKAIFNLIQIWCLTAVVSALFILMTGIQVHSMGRLVACLFTGSSAMVGAVTLCGAIASHASNRAALAATIAIPLVLIPSQWGVNGLRDSFSSIVGFGGSGAAFGLFSYATLSLGIGPWIYAAIWKG